MDVLGYLRQGKVPFKVLRHPPAVDPQQAAELLGLPPEQFFRVVLVRADHGFEHILAIVPASCEVDLAELSKLLGDADLELASSEQIAEQFPDNPPEALPPFGSEFGTKTVIDERLTEWDEIYFATGRPGQAVRLAFADFRRLEEPLILRCAREMNREIS